MHASRTLRLMAAFVAIYFIWGSTFLAIKVVVGHLPPSLMAGVPSLAAGAILLAWARLRGTPWPGGRAWGYGIAGGDAHVPRGSRHAVLGVAARGLRARGRAGIHHPLVDRGVRRCGGGAGAEARHSGWPGTRPRWRCVAQPALLGGGAGAGCRP
jgi:hypothetical protein